MSLDKIRRELQKSGAYERRDRHPQPVRGCRDVGYAAVKQREDKFLNTRGLLARTLSVLSVRQLRSSLLCHGVA